MITNHYKEMFEERVMTLPLDKTELVDIQMNIMKEWRITRGEEGVCVHVFDIGIIEKDPVYHRRKENELWVIYRFGVMVTIHRRDSDHTYNTNPQSMKVDTIRYSFN